jgi:hypothetical protein
MEWCAKRNVPENGKGGTSVALRTLGVSPDCKLVLNMWFACLTCTDGLLAMSIRCTRGMGRYRTLSIYEEGPHAALILEVVIGFHARQERGKYTSSYGWMCATRGR